MQGFTATRAAVLLGAMLSIQGHALAQASASATLTNLRYELIDLDPSDGVAPALQWVQAGAESAGWTTRQEPPLGNQPSFELVTNSQTSKGSAWGSDSSVLFPSAQAQTSSEGMSASAEVPLGGVARLHGSSQGSFTLTPFTAVTFHADAGVAGNATAPVDVLYPYEPFYVWAYYDALASASLNADAPGGTVLATGPTDQSIHLRGNAPDALTSDDKTARLSVTVQNPSQWSLEGSVHALAQVDVYSLMPPPGSAVPEPASYMQMFLGLGSLAWLLRRTMP